MASIVRSEPPSCDLDGTPLPSFVDGAANEMGPSLPDPSLQLKALDVISFKVLEKNGDVNFPLALARNDLQLQGRPTQDTILKYYDHLLAELQQAAPAKTTKSPNGAPPQLGHWRSRRRHVNKSPLERCTWSMSRGPCSWRIWPRSFIRRQGCWSSFVSVQRTSLRHGETEQLQVACLLCLVMALSAQPAGATRETDPEPATRFLQIIGLDEITLVTFLVCIAAVVLWEVQRLFGGFLCQTPPAKTRSMAS